jgi:hypothetical protein
MPADPRPLLDRYLPRRRWFETGFWIAFFFLGAIVNTAIVRLDMDRAGLRFHPWGPAVWEWSSHLVALALVPAVVAFEARRPLHIGSLRRNLPWHALASVMFCVVHVLAFVAIRKAAYAAMGATYSFGNWPRELLYEYLKDFRGYATILLIVGVYRLVLWRLQGEAKLLEAPDSGPSEGSIERPERFLVKKLGKEFLLPANEIEYVSAMGNYVNLHVRGRDYPLRATMQGIEARLDPKHFRRIHRSYIVNVNLVDHIEPAESGDATVMMKTGASLSMSRRYRENIEA